MRLTSRYTDFTYARDSHPSIAYYEGFVGVRGADWIKEGIYWCYPVYSEVSFDVPMFPIQSVKVTSQGLNDTVPRSDSIRVYDNPLPLEKTKSYWNIRLDTRPYPWPDGYNQ